MWSFGVVMVSPSFNDDLSFSQRVKDFAVQQFISHPLVEALAIPVLPRRPKLDVCCLRSNSFDPVSDSLSNELGAVI
jgi:hypothetical protein